MSFPTQVKDVNKLILETLDDQTLLQILSTNKELLKYGEEAFQKRLKVKYPFLINFKPPNIPWRKFYLEMVYYINKLKEDYNIDYIPAPMFNPKNLYKGLRLLKTHDTKFNNTKYKYIAEAIVQINDEKALNEAFKDYYSLIYYYVKLFALKYKNIPLFDKFYYNRKVSLFQYMNYAVQSNDMNVIKYVYDISQEFGHPNPLFGSAIEGVGATGNKALLYPILELFKNDNYSLVELLIGAAIHNKNNFIKELFKKEDPGNLLEALTFTFVGFIRNMDWTVPEEENLETLKLLMNKYLSLGGSSHKFYKKTYTKFTDLAKESSPKIAEYLNSL